MENKQNRLCEGHIFYESNIQVKVPVFMIQIANTFRLTSISHRYPGQSTGLYDPDSKYPQFDIY